MKITTLSVELRSSDIKFAELSKLFTFGYYRKFLLLCGLVFLFFFSLILIYEDTKYENNFRWIGRGCLILAALPLIWKLILAGIRYEIYSKQGGPIICSISDAGLQWQISKTTCLVRWSGVSSIRETSSYIFLKIKPVSTIFTMYKEKIDEETLRRLRESLREAPVENKVSVHSIFIR